MNPSLNFWGPWLGWSVGVAVGVGVGMFGDSGLGGGIVTGTSLEVSKKAPATHSDFDFFQKNPPF